ncbi:hypothetical protein D3C86_2121340 [compost metagenome]
MGFIVFNILIAVAYFKILNRIKIRESINNLLNKSDLPDDPLLKLIFMTIVIVKNCRIPNFVV